MQQLYDFLYKPPTKLMLLTGCSPVTTVIAEAAPVWKLVVVCYNGYCRLSIICMFFSYHMAVALLHCLTEIGFPHYSEHIHQPTCRTLPGTCQLEVLITVQI